MGKGRPRATKQLAQAAGGRGRIEPRLGCFLMWPLYLVRPHPFLLGKSLPKAESHSSGRGGFVRPASASRGLPAHRASSWLLLSAQRRVVGAGEVAASLGSQLPHLFGGEVGGAQRADLLCLQRLGLHPSLTELER